MASHSQVILTAFICQQDHHTVMFFKETGRSLGANDNLSARNHSQTDNNQSPPLEQTLKFNSWERMDLLPGKLDHRDPHSLKCSFPTLCLLSASVEQQKIFFKYRSALVNPSLQPLRASLCPSAKSANSYTSPNVISSPPFYLFSPDSH